MPPPGVLGAVALPQGWLGSPFQGGRADSSYNVAKSQYDVACYQNSQPHP
jgi:hypothetical protein